MEPGNTTPTPTEDVEKIADLRKRIHEDTTLSELQKKYSDDACLSRFLRARKGDVAKAEEMLRAALKWRQENNIFGIRAEEVESQVLAGHMYTHGFGLHGEPICVLRMHTVADPHNNEQKLRFMVYSLERAIRLMPPGVEKCIWLVQCQGYNMKYNGELSFARLLLQTLQDYFPERLACLVLCDPPFVFKTMWAIISPFIDANTCKKIRFISGTDEQKRKLLSELFDLNQVEKDMAGTSTFKFDGQEYLQQCKTDESNRVGMIHYNPDEVRLQYGMKLPAKSS